MTTNPTCYRFGDMTYTLANVARVGYAHGRDGILFYAPVDWGKDAPIRPRCVILTGLDILGETYLSAYRRGYYDRPR
jgi:hypothetical protein